MTATETVKMSDRAHERGEKQCGGGGNICGKWFIHQWKQVKSVSIHMEVQVRTYN